MLKLKGPPRFMLCVAIQTASDAKAGRSQLFENFLTDLDPQTWLAEAVEKHFNQFGAHVVIVAAFPLTSSTTPPRLLEIVRDE